MDWDTIASLVALESDVSDAEDIALLGLCTIDTEMEFRGLESFTDDEVRQMCRFHKEDIRQLRDALGIPAELTTEPERYRMNGDDAVMITLRRFVYPNRLSDLSTVFGVRKSKLSSCINTVVNMVHEKWSHLLGYHVSRFEPNKLSQYADAITLAGCPIPRCIGFIDGTVRPVCRPSRNQGAIYNGHKRLHGLKFQSIMTPDGIISYLDGPYTGNRHDSAILVMSGLLDLMRDRMRDEKGPYCIFGDSGYPVCPQLLCPYKGANLTADQTSFNSVMSRHRITVEWGFGQVLNNFAFLDFRKNQKLLLQPVGKYYAVGVLFTNCLTALYGSNVCRAFNTQPPRLREYLSPP
jgi:hypothetical protein